MVFSPEDSSMCVAGFVPFVYDGQATAARFHGCALGAAQQRRHVEDHLLFGSGVSAAASSRGRGEW